MFRLTLGLLATMSQGGMGLVLLLTKLPTTETLNIRFLGEFMLVIACILFAMTIWAFEQSKSE